MPTPHNALVAPPPVRACVLRARFFCSLRVDEGDRRRKGMPSPRRWKSGTGTGDGSRHVRVRDLFVAASPRPAQWRVASPRAYELVLLRTSNYYYQVYHYSYQACRHRPPRPRLPLPDARLHPIPDCSGTSTGEYGTWELYIRWLYCKIFSDITCNQEQKDTRAVGQAMPPNLKNASATSEAAAAASRHPMAEWLHRFLHGRQWEVGFGSNENKGTLQETSLIIYISLKVMVMKKKDRLIRSKSIKNIQGKI